MKTFILTKARIVYSTFLLSTLMLSASTMNAQSLIPSSDLDPLAPIATSKKVFVTSGSAKSSTTTLTTTNSFKINENNMMAPACPVISITGATSVCSGESATLNVSPAGLPGYTYEWNPGAVSGSSFNTGPLTATSTFTVTVSDGDSCILTLSYTVTVNQPTFPTFKPVDPVCGGDFIPPLPLTSQNGITGTWSPAINNTATTTYTFTPNPGQCASSRTLTIEVDPCCYQPDFCFTVENRKVSFSSVDPAVHPSPCVYRYKWYWGDGTSSQTFNNSTAARNASKTYATEGSYDVCLEIKRICPGSQDTCCKVICKTINTIQRCLSQDINADLTVSLRSTAAGTVVSPIVGQSGFRSYIGSEIRIDYGTPSIPSYVGTTTSNNFPVANAVVTYTTPGNYEYCVTVKYVNAMGDSCVDKKCRTITIEPWCATQATFKMSSCATGFAHTFTPIGNSPGAIVNWTFSLEIPSQTLLTQTSVGNDPVTHFSGNTIYEACMRVQDGKCYSSACYTVFSNGSTTTSCGPNGSSAINTQNPVNLDNLDLKSVLIPTEEGKENVSSAVYPNPTSSEINLLMHAAKSSVAKIDVISSTGKILQSRTTSVNEENSKETFDFSNLENGMYVLRVEVDGQVNIHKISVAK